MPSWARSGRRRSIQGAVCWSFEVTPISQLLGLHDAEGHGRRSLSGAPCADARFERPVLVVWADADDFMPVASARWLEAHVPGVERVVIVPGAKLFFPEEEHERLSWELRAFWGVER